MFFVGASILLASDSFPNLKQILVCCCCSCLVCIMAVREYCTEMTYKGTGLSLQFI